MRKNRLSLSWNILELDASAACAYYGDLVVQSVWPLTSSGVVRMLQGMLQRLLLSVFLLGVASPAPVFGGPDAPLAVPFHASEDLLLKAVNKILRGQMPEALQAIETLVQKNPDFKLAHLIYGDLLRAKAHGLTDVGGQASAPPEHVRALREELVARWQARTSQPARGMMPKYVLQLAPRQRYAAVVDLAQSRLYVFANRQGVPRLVADFYISSGRNGAPKAQDGDQRTPVGVYVVTGRLPVNGLPALYGSGAFPLNYPNEWDQRQGRTGHGIWLHGTFPGTYSRPPRDSDGCVAVSNVDLQALDAWLEGGRTPVLIAEHVEWTDKQPWSTVRTQFRSVLERWRRDWESRDTERYLRHYSQAFRGPGQDYSAWARHTRWEQAHKTFIKVELSEVSMFLYPGEADLMVVSFQQEYRDDTQRVQADRRQYWRKERGNIWRIIYEGPA